MNFIKKSILCSCFLLVLGASLEARRFLVMSYVINDIPGSLSEGKITKFTNIFDIFGHPSAPENPTYGQIRRKLAEKFRLDPHWSNFMIKYFDPVRDKVYFLKPHIENLSRKERAQFYDNLERLTQSQIGLPEPYIVLFLLKRPAKEVELEGDDWMLDETSLAGESDPLLVKKLQDAVKNINN